VLNVSKVLLLAKQTQVHAKKTRGAGIDVTQKVHHETWNANLCWQCVQAFAMPCRIAFENCRCSWNRSSWRSDFKICLFSVNFPIFIAHHQRGNKGHNSKDTIHRAPDHCGWPKCHNVITSFFNTVGLHYFRKTSGSNMGAPNLFLVPGAI